MQNVQVLLQPTEIETQAAYADSRLVGSVEGNKAVQYSPVSFQATVGGDKGTGWSHILPLSVFAPQVKKIYVVYCREIEACSNYNNRVKEFAPQIGLQVVGSSQSSIAQPDQLALRVPHLAAIGCHTL